MLPWYHKQVKTSQENETTYMFMSRPGSWPTETEMMCGICRLGGRQSSLEKHNQPRSPTEPGHGYQQAPSLRPPLIQPAQNQEKWVNTWRMHPPLPPDFLALTGFPSPGLHPPCWHISLLSNIQQLPIAYWRRSLRLACEAASDPPEKVVQQGRVVW